ALVLPAEVASAQVLADVVALVTCGVAQQLVGHAIEIAALLAGPFLARLLHRQLQPLPRERLHHEGVQVRRDLRAVGRLGREDEGLAHAAICTRRSGMCMRANSASSTARTSQSRSMPG